MYVHMNNAQHIGVSKNPLYFMLATFSSILIVVKADDHIFSTLFHKVVHIICWVSEMLMHINFVAYLSIVFVKNILMYILFEFYGEKLEKTSKKLLLIKLPTYL